MDDLREQWKVLYSETLPTLARTRDPAQPRWPVTLDHCFARIILDNTIGQGQRQWDHIIDKPALRSMDEAQFRNAIVLGEDIAMGKVDLCQLDELSLRCRGKADKKYSDRKSASPRPDLKRKGVTQAGKQEDQQNERNQPHLAIKRQRLERGQSILQFPSTSRPAERKFEDGSAARRIGKNEGNTSEMKLTLARVRTYSGLTPYRTKLYTTLLSVPKGRYTTYAAMSDFLKSSARAVGNGMRNNPFAPDVPCHRVLAANGTIGGFNGDWGKDGKYARKKIEMLRGEGVRFDPSGKVIGEPFRKFHLFQGLEWET